MFGRVPRTPYLVKASDDYISWCQCDDAPIGIPRQESCPWCGCGWLFTCINCNKAFTFAKAVLLAQPLEKLARIQVPVVRRVMYPDGRTVETPIAVSVVDWCGLMRPLLQNIVLGKTYVYFDGSVIPTDAGRVRLVGKRRTHDLGYIPQVRALTDPASADETLNSVEYWTAQDAD